MAARIERLVSGLRETEKYYPEPDVTVIETAFALGQIYVERFYFVAEILSESDRREVLEAKLAYYQPHEHNKCVLFVRQDRVGADQQDRQADGTWQARALTTPEARSRFPASARSGASAISTNSRRSIHSHARDRRQIRPSAAAAKQGGSVMDFGVATSTRGALGNREGYIAVAEAAERLGFGFISVNDHIIVPRDIASRYPYSEAANGRAARPAIASISWPRWPFSPAAPSGCGC